MSLECILLVIEQDFYSSKTVDDNKEWVDVHGDTCETGTQMPRASQRMAPPLEDLEAPFSLGDLGDILLGDSEGLAIEVEVTNEAENEADIAAHNDTGGDDVATRESWDGVVQEHEGVN
ncbi:hypothetical protein E4U59_004804 [Claviceps monticola]|nr:hypothetical protein E4U59_004804 [Claviceps monticola]